jgi:hypothetical protein
MDGIPSTSSLLRESAFKTVQLRNPNLAIHNPRQFMKEVCDEYITQRIQAFPEMCETARIQNALKWQDLQKNGHQGKYTGTYGWSESGDYCFKYDVPEELFLFMQNLIYKDFWSDSNKNIREKFMKRVCAGDDPGRLLIWVKSQYGANSQEGIVN